MKVSERLTRKEMEGIADFVKIQMAVWYKFLWENVKKIEIAENRGEYTNLYVAQSFTNALEFIFDFMAKDAKEFINCLDMFKEIIDQIEKQVKEDIDGK